MSRAREVAIEECSVCGTPWPYDRRSRKRTHTPCAGSRKVTRVYVSIDAVAQFLFDDGKSTAAAKVLAEFGALSGSSS